MQQGFLALEQMLELALKLVLDLPALLIDGLGLIEVEDVDMGGLFGGDDEY